MSREPLDKKLGGKNIYVRIGRIYSDIFSPPSLFAIFAFIIAWSDLPFWRGTFHAAIFGVLTSLTPLIYLIIQIKRGKLDDIHISTSDQRVIPYILGVVGASIAYFVLRQIGTSPLFLTFIISVIIGLAVLGILNSWFLISAHSASISAVTTFSFFAFGLTVALALSPLILSTVLVRYFLKRHSIIELTSGVLVGIVVVVSLSFFGLFR